MGTFTGARRHVLHTFATTQSAAHEEARALQYMLSTRLPHLPRQAPAAGVAVGHVRRARHRRAVAAAAQAAGGAAAALRRGQGQASSRTTHEHPEQAIVAQRIAEDLVARLAVLLDLGLGYLSLERSTPTLSPGELQRLRLATQLYSNLFGVVYVLDEPSAGLHPADTEALLAALAGLKAPATPSSWWSTTWT